MAFRKKSYKKAGTKRRTYKRKGYKGAAKATKKVMRKVARAEIHKMAEDKFIYEWGNNYSIQTGTNALLDQCIKPLTPGVNNSFAITTGAGRTSRVGNKISTKGLQIKGLFYPVPQSVVQNNAPTPILLDVYCFYDKQNPNGITVGTANQPPTPAQNGDFFYQQGNSTATTGFTFLIADHNRPVNDSRYKVFWKKSYKVGFQNYSFAGAQPTDQDFSNNDFRNLVEFDYHLYKHAPKEYTYPDGTTIYPRQHGLWLLFLPMRIDGSAPQAGELDIFMSYSCRYRYEDC